MKKAQILFFLFLFCLFLFISQNADAQEEIDKCYHYLNTFQYQKAIESGTKAAELYPKNPYPYICLGQVYFYTGNINLAISNLETAEKLVTDKKDLKDVYSLLCVFYGQINDLEKALPYCDKGIALSTELGDVNTAALMLTGIGSVMKNRGNYDKALDYYKQALKLSVDETTKSTIYYTIATLYDVKGDFDSALNYIEEAIKLCQKNKMYPNLGIMYAHTGMIYMKKGDKQTAKEYFTKAYNLFKLIGNKEEANKVYVFLQKLENN